MYVFFLFFSNNKDSLFSDNKFFLTGSGRVSRTIEIGSDISIFPVPIQLLFYLLRFCEQNQSAQSSRKNLIKNFRKILSENEEQFHFQE